MYPALVKFAIYLLFWFFVKIQSLKCLSMGVWEQFGVKCENFDVFLISEKISKKFWSKMWVKKCILITVKLENFGVKH